MIDMLAKQKENVAKASRDYSRTTVYQRKRLERAKRQTADWTASPSGILTIFALGAGYQIASNKRSPSSNLIMTILNNSIL